MYLKTVLLLHLSILVSLMKRRLKRLLLAGAIIPIYFVNILLKRLLREVVAFNGLETKKISIPKRTSRVQRSYFKKEETKSRACQLSGGFILNLYHRSVFWLNFYFVKDLIKHVFSYVPTDLLLCCWRWQADHL